MKRTYQVQKNIITIDQHVVIEFQVVLSEIVAKIEIYNDSWLMMPQYAELFTALAGITDDWSMAKVEDILQSLGYSAQTEV